MSPDPATRLALIAEAGKAAGLALASGLIAWPAARDDCPDVAALRPDDIGDAFARNVFDVVGRLYADGGARSGRIDIGTLYAELVRTDRWDSRTLAVDVANLIELDPSGANVPRNARVLRSLASVRDVLGVATDLERAAYDAPIDPDNPTALLADIAPILARLDDVPTTLGPVRLRDSLTVAVDLLRRRQERDPSQIRFGLDRLDDLIHGLEAGQLLIIAARPSVGKTALALLIAYRNAVLFGLPSLFTSLEMPHAELSIRLLTMMTGIPAGVFRSGRASPDEFERIDRAAAELAAAPLEIHDRSGLRVGEIASAARRMKRRGGLSLIIVDYLQLLTPNDRRANANRAEQVSQLSRDLKGLARELGVPVIALAQLNREVESRPGGRPRLADLRESGSIEQDADIVILLSRQSDQSADAAQWDIIADVAKHRNGPTGEVLLTYHRSSMLFADPAPC